MDFYIDLLTKFQLFHVQKKKRNEIKALGWEIKVLDIVDSKNPSCTVHIDSNVFMAQICLWASGELNFEYLLIEKPDSGSYSQYEISNEDELTQKLSEVYSVLREIVE
jgi:hypothetical protein